MPRLTKCAKVTKNKTKNKDVSASETGWGSLKKHDTQIAGTSKENIIWRYNFGFFGDSQR